MRAASVAEYDRTGTAAADEYCEDEDRWDLELADFRACLGTPSCLMMCDGISLKDSMLPERVVLEVLLSSQRLHLSLIP